MILDASLVISVLSSRLPELSQPIKPTSEQVIRQPISIASGSYNFSTEAIESVPSALEEFVGKSCDSVPNGIGIPGFQPGIQKRDVLKMLGVPTSTAAGYWQNTDAVAYHLIPDQVSLGFLFDKNSGRIRQTEAAFNPNVNSRTIQVTLNGMLGCKLNQPIQLGLKRVWEKQSQLYSFSLGSLRGVIERQKGDRLYIGIWEADLHRKRQGR